MELRAKVLYHAGFGTLNAGDTTAAFDIPEELKTQMLEDHPDWFEVVGKTVGATPVARPTEPEDGLPIQTPEDALKIETPEAKTGKLRKK